MHMMNQMEFKKEKLVRFCSDEKQNLEVSWEKGESQPIERPVSYKVLPSLLNPEGRAGEKNRTYGTLSFGRFKVFPESHEPWRKRILDPGSDIFLQWNRVFLFSCLVALFVDPLFFYLPTVVGDGNSSCVKTDLNLGIVVTCFRTIADVFYLLHMAIKFRTAYVSPSSRVFGRGELVMDPKEIARRYLKSDFFIDLVATLPLPQIVIWFVIPAIRSSHADHTNNALVLIVLLQYVPRLYLIFPLSSQIIKATGVVTKTAWAGAAYNLLLYMLASHVLGASWYLLSIERHATCWKSVCRKELSPIRCFLRFLDCGTLDDDDRRKWNNSTFVFSDCDPSKDISFNYGIFGDAIKKNVVYSKFLEKYFYCLWWGLQNLSSYGQSLSTSTFIGETAFAILIAILGLVLFAHLIGNMQVFGKSCSLLTSFKLSRTIFFSEFHDFVMVAMVSSSPPFLSPVNLRGGGNTGVYAMQDGSEIHEFKDSYKVLMLNHIQHPELGHNPDHHFLPHSLLMFYLLQTYLQSITVRLEEWRLKRRDTEEWMRHRQLPQDLRERVRRFVQYKWLATRGVDEESILRALPTDLRRDIQRHLCLDLVRRVPFFSQMDDQLLDAICERLVSSLSTQGTYIVREGDPVTEMLFIIRGRLESSTTNGGRTGFFNSITLRPVRALVEVEAFALRAEDLKFVANQFRRLHSKKLQHTFRFYSHHWRTWAACFIQAAWRRYKKRIMAKNLSMRESFSFADDDDHADDEDETEQEDEGSSTKSNSSQAKQHLGVTILASRFAKNTRRGAQKVKDVEMPKLQKPEEPDFSIEPDDY
ncbi:putative cyclic nucleotide-gated ion channel 14 [Vitis vinifera]|uniref:Putative cyclic nucleotide-gated ion channel 14 n=1 Tax=Vitis vinifera TaxID=29760 RepID=A0A438HIE7_VITVI|nr:putative cyclic nucleotide-gated ion channel 14 [Vitis vinifera]